MRAPTATRTLVNGLCGLLLLTLFGCTVVQVTKTERTAIEQLLISSAVDEALEGVSLPEVRGRSVFFSADYLQSIDLPYLAGSIRALLSENGALLVPERGDAELVVEARSGALGIDPSEGLLGIPSIPIVLPGGSLEIPEVALYSSEKADALASVALLAYEAETGEPVFSSGPFVGEAHFHSYKFLLLINLNFTDIEERERY